MPAFRPAPSSILRAFQNSKKKHLLITGSRGIGKTTLLNSLLPLLFPLLLSGNSDDSNDPNNSNDFNASNAEAYLKIPGFSTHAIPKTRVEIQDRITGKTGIIGTFSADLASRSEIPSGCRMQPCPDGFLEVGIPAIQRAILTSTEEAPWAVIDEIGCLETSCEPFLKALVTLFDTRPVIAVIRKQSLPFLDELKHRPDVFVIDLDEPVLPIGCVIMASGLGRRFGSDKLMASFQGKPLIAQILRATSSALFADRIVVTRSKAVQTFCETTGIPVLFHEFPNRKDTVRLGLTALLQSHPELKGCLFALGDQPLLSRETLETMAIAFSQNLVSRSCENEKAISSKKGQGIFRLCFEEPSDVTDPKPSVTVGSPVLFSDFFFEELLALPAGKGGSFLIRNYPEDVHLIPALSPYELMDVDTPENLNFLLDHADPDPSSSHSEK